MTFLIGTISLFEVIFTIVWIVFSILLTFGLRMLTKDHQKNTSKKKKTRRKLGPFSTLFPAEVPS